MRVPRDADVACQSLLARLFHVRLVAGFPGHTLTQPQLQFEVASKLLATGRRLAPRCKTFDVVQTELISKPRNRTAAWTERWSLYMCGEIHRQRVRFMPDSQGRTAFRLAD